MLATQKTFLDLLISVEHKLVMLGWATVTRVGNRRTVYVTEPRVLKWAIAVLERHGVDSGFIAAILKKTPPPCHWHRIRAHLPESAFYVLDGKLDGFLLSDESDQ